MVNCHSTEYTSVTLCPLVKARAQLSIQPSRYAGQLPVQGGNFDSDIEAIEISKFPAKKNVRHLTYYNR